MNTQEFCPFFVFEAESTGEDPFDVRACKSGHFAFAKDEDNVPVTVFAMVIPAIRGTLFHPHQK